MEMRRALLLLWAGASNAVNPMDDVLGGAIQPPTDSLAANQSSSGPEPLGMVALPAVDIGAPAEASAPAEKGDPIFKHNGTSTHFWIKAGVSTPLLNWTSHDGMNKLELSGKTFARKMTGDQWFKELVLKCDGSEVLTLTAQSNHKSGGPMLVKQSLNTTGVNITVHDAKGLSSGRQWAESVEVESNGIAFSIKSASATKFVKAGPKDEFHHLNLEFPNGLNTAKNTLPSGILAQFAGVQTMVADTEKMLKRPITKQQKHKRHARQVARKKQEKQNLKVMATRYVNNDHTVPAK